MVDGLDHADGIIYYDLWDSSYLKDDAYSLSCALENTNTEKTYAWLNDPEGVSGDFKGGENLVYLSATVCEWGVVHENNKRIKILT